MSERKVPVIVLAGGPTKPEIQAKGWPAWRALAPIGGKPAVVWVLDALRKAETTGDIAVVGPEELRPLIGDATLLPNGETMWDNVATGLRHVGDGKALLAGADVPLLTPEAVDDVVTRGSVLNADFVYPIIRKEHNLEQCPGLSRTYGTLVEGTFTGGNLMLVNAPVILAQDAVIRRALAARKKPLELARMLNPWVVVKILCKRAKVSDLERLVGKILGAKAVALPTPYAEIGADLDSPDETPTMEALMRQKGLL